MTDMLKYAKNLKNFEELGAPGFFFVSEWNITVEVLDI